MSAVAIAWALALIAAPGAGARAEDAFQAAANAMRAELDDRFIVERAGAFVVAGELPRRSFDALKQHTIEGCAAALWKDFFRKKPDAPIRVYLFADKPSYEKWVKKLAGFAPSSPYGFYLRERRSLMMNIATGGGTLVHEMTHALMDPDFPDCPTWLFEGLGSLFEQCHTTPDGHIEGRVNWRLPGLRKGGFVSLQALMEMSNADFRGPKESLHYANARYLCLYLQHRGLLTKFYAAFRDAHKAGKDRAGWETLKQIIAQPPDEFEKQWHDWVKTLKWPE
jgi:hypothetical protein